jgi:hypothetical protein
MFSSEVKASLRGDKVLHSGIIIFFIRWHWQSSYICGALTSVYILLKGGKKNLCKNTKKFFLLKLFRLVLVDLSLVKLVFFVVDKIS